MDLDQQKLSKSEWNNIEVPVSESEKKILEIILQGYHDVNIRINETSSLLSHIKIENNPSIELELYKKYFEPKIESLKKKYMTIDKTTVNTEKKPKKTEPHLYSQ